MKPNYFLGATTERSVSPTVSFSNVENASIKKSRSIVFTAQVLLKTTLLILLFLLNIGGVNAQNSQQDDYIKDELYFKFSDSFELTWKLGNDVLTKEDMPSSLNFLFTDYEVLSLQVPFCEAMENPVLQRTMRVKLATGSDLSKVILKLSNLEIIDYAERIPVDRLHVMPNDPSIGTQWSLTKIRAFEAHNITNGSNSIDVAVVDSGVQTDHVDLQSNMEQGRDVSDNDNDPNPIDQRYDHGTHVGGLVAAATNNGIGMASVGNRVDIIPVKATNSTDPRLITHGYSGILWAAMNGAEIINCSFGGSGYSQTNQNVINAAYSYGVIIVGSAGNDDTSVESFPAAYSNVIAVASSTQSDNKSSFSNYGNWVDITAPGSSIYSTELYDSYGNKSGTSMAAPIVSGALALVWSVDTSMTRDEVVNCVLNNTSSLSWSGSGTGLLDVKAAVDCAIGSNNPIVCDCPYLNDQFPNQIFNPSGVFQSINGIYAGEYQEFNVVAGQTYIWSYCSSDGGSANDDLRLNLYDSNNNKLDCVMDVCGLDPRLVWTSTLSGVVKLQTNMYVSGSQQCEVNNNGATLVYKQDSSNSGSENIFLTGAQIVGSATISAGGVLDVEAYQNYNGNSNNVPNVYMYYVLDLNNNGVYDSGDILLYSSDYSTIDATDPQDKESEDLTIPSNLPPGTYCILLIADATDVISESDELDNFVTCLQFTITGNNSGSENIFLTGAQIVGSATISAGGVLDVEAYQNYNGNSNNVPNVYMYYVLDLNNNGVYDSGDILLYSSDYSTIDATDPQDKESEDFTIPSNLPPGTYCILLIADATDVISESDELDNSVSCLQFNISDSLGNPEESIISNFAFYPNPVQETLIIKSTSIIETYSIYSLSGQMIRSGKVQENLISMDFLSSGMYLLKVVGENGASKTVRVLKE